jgi:hypothetical protein
MNPQQNRNDVAMQRTIAFVRRLEETLNAGISVDAIRMMLDIGGPDRFMTCMEGGYVYTEGDTELHRMVCSKNESIDAINALINRGGKQLVLARNVHGETALSMMCRENPSNTAIMNKLISVGGEKLVMATMTSGSTALQWACERGVSNEIINKLIDIGGKRLVVKANAESSTALHDACLWNASIDMINKMVDIGGKELLAAKCSFGHYGLANLIMSDDLEVDNRINKIISLISKGIQYQIGGEFGIGGLFNLATDEVQDLIYKNWNEFVVPALDIDIALCKDVDMSICSKQPILHAAIISKAPLCIIRQMINKFDCISTEDSMGRYPIDVAVKEGLKWDDGMKDIVHAFTDSTVVQGQTRLMINVAALHGLKWENGMKEVTLENINQIASSNVDTLTGLFPFMLAATGDNSDLDAIYELLRANPKSVQMPNFVCKRLRDHRDIHHMTPKRYRAE